MVGVDRREISSKSFEQLGGVGDGLVTYRKLLLDNILKNGEKDKTPPILSGLSVRMFPSYVRRNGVRRDTRLAFDRMLAASATAVPIPATPIAAKIYINP